MHAQTRSDPLICALTLAYSIGGSLVTGERRGAAFGWLALGFIGPAVLMLAAEGHAIPDIESIEARYAQVKTIEQARREYFSGPLERAADAYLVKRGQGKTLVAVAPLQLRPA